MSRSSQELYTQGLASFASELAHSNHYIASARRTAIRISSSFTGAHNQGLARSPANGAANTGGLSIFVAA